MCQALYPLCFTSPTHPPTHQSSKLTILWPALSGDEQAAQERAVAAQLPTMTSTKDSAHIFLTARLMKAHRSFSVGPTESLTETE